MKSKNNFLLFTIIWVMFSCLCCIDVHAITTGDTFGQNDVNSKIITDTAKLTVYDVWDGEAFSAYKILDAFYNSSTNVVSYEFTFDFQSFLMSEEGKDYSDLTVDDWYHYKDNSSDFNHLINAYTSYIKKNFIHGIPMDTNDNERISSKTLQAGSYLVLPTNAIAVYSVMIGNLDVTAVENDWQINGAEIRAKSELPEVEKCVFDSIMGDWSTSSASIASYSMGDVIPFKIEATLPTYPSDATNKTYVITDVISEILQHYSEYGGGYPWNKMWKRDAIISEGDDFPLFDRELFYFEDLEWVIRMMLRIHKVVVCPAHLYSYYIHKDSVTHSKNNSERKEIGYHQSINRVIEDLSCLPDLQKKFSEQYFPEIVNGLIHARRNRWENLRKYLFEVMREKQAYILKSKSISLNIKLRCVIMNILG